MTGDHTAICQRHHSPNPRIDGPALAGPWSSEVKSGPWTLVPRRENHESHSHGTVQRFHDHRQITFVSRLTTGS